MARPRSCGNRLSWQPAGCVRLQRLDHCRKRMHAARGARPLAVVCLWAVLFLMSPRNLHHQPGFSMAQRLRSERVIAPQWSASSPWPMRRRFLWAWLSDLIAGRGLFLHVRPAGGLFLALPSIHSFACSRGLLRHSALLRGRLRHHARLLRRLFWRADVGSITADVDGMGFGSVWARY